MIERKLFYIMPLTPVFSTSAVAGITQDYPGVSRVFHFLPHLFCILAVVARAIAEQHLCLSAYSRDEKCRNCIMSKPSSTFLRNINHLLNCFTDVKSVICSKYPSRRCLLVSPILYKMVSYTSQAVTPTISFTVNKRNAVHLLYGP